MEEIFQTYLTATNDDLNGAAGKLKEMTPSPMNTMLEKETKSDAIKKKQERSKKVVEDVPPTTRGIKEHMEPLSLISWVSFITKYPLVLGSRPCRYLSSIFVEKLTS